MNPELLMLSTKQNAFSRIFTMSVLPFQAASWSAVLPNYRYERRIVLPAAHCSYHKAAAVLQLSVV